MRSLKETANRVLNKHLPTLLTLDVSGYVDLPETYEVSLRMPKMKPLPDPGIVLTALLSLALPLPEGHTIESWTEHLKTTLIQAGIDADHVDKMFKLKEV